MAEISASVESYIGYTLSDSTVPTRTQLNEYIKDGVVDIVNKSILAEPRTASQFAKWAKDESAASGTEVPSGMVLQVNRENGTDGEVNEATEISYSQKSRSLDPQSIHYVGKNNPKWYWDESSNKRKVVCLPVTSNADGQRYNVQYVHYTTTLEDGSALSRSSDIDSTKIAYFPIHLQPYLIIYCAIRCLYLFVATEMKKNSALFDIDLDDDDNNDTAESILHWLNQEDPEMVQATINAQGAEGQFLMSYLQKIATLKSQYDALFQIGAQANQAEKER
ncbi:hypothetical protein [Acinetobacter sp.]|uniref:hypothetical protein n=1 Tax=Acinetobacter sp. TaxID=472 RepID=UPI000C09F79A|nr:hypothetical protein [Acinetobacter sp.]MAK31679.1 hypothetical protein [Acinetobacter sp.]QDP47186.1 MAG: hypothetical protein GOVbin655_20 [Prokaryotic dsDNA virus sp.]